MNREQFIIDRFKIDTTKEPPYALRISRWKHLPFLMAEMECKVGAEIGVEQGRYSSSLLRKIPGLKLYCIDCWESYEGYRMNKQNKVDLFYQRTIERLESLEGANYEIIKKYSMDAVKDFEDESLDFVFIDGNHEFQSCTNDIAEWSKKVKKGGLIMGHDYETRDAGYEQIEVEDVIKGWTHAKGIKVWFITGELDRSNTWFWVK